MLRNDEQYCNTFVVKNKNNTFFLQSTAHPDLKIKMDIHR